jgi:alcohol dehydrogenase class IV
MKEYSPIPLRKFVAPEFLFGCGAIPMLSRYIKNLGVKKILLVSDPGVVNAGWVSVIEKQIRDTGIPHVLFADVSPNPRDCEVMTGSEIYQKESCDMIVAVGGGSPMDCAKGIGIVCINKSHISEFEGVDKIPLPGPPLVCIPTTSGTSADISQFSIILDSARKVKMAIVSKILVPDAALIDPVTLSTMDAKLTAETGMDALVHAFEAYVSNASSPITDLNALRAVELIRKNLVGMIKCGGKGEEADNMMLGSLLAGLAFSNASLGIVHAMAHALGGFLDLRHGECNAILLEHAVNYNYESAHEKYNGLASAMGIETKGMTDSQIKKALTESIAELRYDSGIRHGFSALGLKKEEIPLLADYALADACIVTNPREALKSEIEELYAAAF